MTKPNYNLIRFIRRCIYQMKREYGGPITVYRLINTDTDLQTGVKTVNRDSIDVVRAVVLPNRLTREAIQSISVISADKKIVQGGTYDPGKRVFIIDRADVPDWDLEQDDWIVYENKRYDIKAIDEFEQKTAWLVIAKEVEGVTPEQDHRETTESLMTLEDSASCITTKWIIMNVADSLGVSDVAYKVLTP